MKTTENERKNAHYVIIQSIIIGEDEYEKLFNKQEAEPDYILFF